ncbi:MAG: hypothetical protein H6981_05965 [Gammaproteobacteria bacterium]|nr:hypothetical protein [Gammaproteobacteria bacterium]MCP5136329.1 hypothetical protein [Gammaproteobacteria bacterium]
MSELPQRKEQIVQFHATLILRTVQACQHPELRAQLEPALDQSVENGWTQLVSALRRILDGSRDVALLRGLDDEDGAIVEAVLNGLRDPNTLPRPETEGDASVAAAGLAGLIHAAGTGDVQALQMISGMAEQMSAAGGPMSQLAALVRPLVNGERDPDRLFDGRVLEADTRDLVVSIIDELGRLDAH